MKIISRRDAIKKGLKLYFTGKPCKHGHVDQRRTAKGGRCLGCEKMVNDSRAEYRADYYKNKYATETTEETKRRKTIAKAWRQNSKEHLNDYQKERLTINKEAHENKKKYNREYSRKRHLGPALKEALKIKNREYYLKRKAEKENK